MGLPVVSKTSKTRHETDVWHRSLEHAQDRGVFVNRAEADRATVGECIGRYIRSHPRSDQPRMIGRGCCSSSGTCLQSLQLCAGIEIVGAVSPHFGSFQMLASGRQPLEFPHEQRRFARRKRSAEAEMTAWCGLRSLQLKLYRRKIHDVAWFFWFYGGAP
jgi:hypothetical protein